MAFLTAGEKLPPEGHFGNRDIGFTRVFTNLSDDNGDGPILACNSSGVPFWGSQYDFGNDGASLFCFLVNKSAKCVAIGSEPSGYNVWEITCDYKVLQNPEAQQLQQPELQKPDLKLSTSMIKIPMDHFYWQDASFPFINSADEKITHLPEQDFSVYHISIARNENLESPIQDLQQTFTNCVNSEEWFGYPAKSVKCDSISATPVFVNLPDSGVQYIYLRVEYDFTVNLLEQGDLPVYHGIRLLDVGTYYKDSGKKVKFKTDDHYTVDVGFLDGSGGKNPDGNDPVWMPVSAAIDRYPTADFSEMGLPESFEEYRAAYYNGLL